MNVTKPQIRIIRTLLSKTGLTEEKESFVMQYTNGRTEHISKMTKVEAIDLIKELTKSAGTDASMKKAKPTPKIFDESDQRMRRHIIAMAHNMNWENPDGSADMDRINGWILRYGHLNHEGYDINDYQGADLQKLVTQFQKVYRHYLIYISKKK